MKGAASLYSKNSWFSTALSSSQGTRRCLFAVLGMLLGAWTLLHQGLGCILQPAPELMDVKTLDEAPLGRHPGRRGHTANESASAVSGH